jgi:hypothetical protein
VIFLSIMRKSTGNSFHSTSSYTLSDGPTEFRLVSKRCVCIVVRTLESREPPHELSKSVAKSRIINGRASINLGSLLKEPQHPRKRTNSQVRRAGGIDLRAWEQ